RCRVRVSSSPPFLSKLCNDGMARGRFDRQVPGAKFPAQRFSRFCSSPEFHRSVLPPCRSDLPDEVQSQFSQEKAAVRFPLAAWRAREQQNRCFVTKTGLKSVSIERTQAPLSGLEPWRRTDLPKEPKERPVIGPDPKPKS